MPAPAFAASILFLALIVSACDSSKKRSACGGDVVTDAAGESLASQQLAEVCEWHLSPRLAAGARIFVSSGCTACHTYRGIGARNLGAPDLTAAGRQHGVRYFERYVRNPAAFGDDVMPRFVALGALRLEQVATFLAASKGAS